MQYIETSISRLLFSCDRGMIFLWFTWSMSIYSINILSVCLAVKLQKDINKKILCNCWKVSWHFVISWLFCAFFYQLYIFHIFFLNFKDLRHFRLLSSLLKWSQFKLTVLVLFNLSLIISWILNATMCTIFPPRLKKLPIFCNPLLEVFLWNSQI